MSLYSENNCLHCDQRMHSENYICPMSSKQYVTCPHCGEILTPNNEYYCPNCGKALPAGTKAELRRISTVSSRGDICTFTPAANPPATASSDGVLALLMIALAFFVCLAGGGL